MPGGLSASAIGRTAMVLGVLLALGACDGAPDTETRILARQQAIDPPQLWLVQALGDAGAVKGSVFVCADTALRETFVRTRAEVNGEICRDTTSPVMKTNEWALRCEAGGLPFAISASTVGDPQRDFRLDFGLTQLYYFPTVTGPQRMSVRQSRHFRRIGACPAGWRIGDQARPGKRPHRT
jgi:hypothetical protein